MPQIRHQDGALWSDTKMVLERWGHNGRPRFKITGVVVVAVVMIVLSDALMVPSPS
jgi:hypothetical protein